MGFSGSPVAGWLPGMAARRARLWSFGAGEQQGVAQRGLLVVEYLLQEG